MRAWWTSLLALPLLLLLATARTPSEAAPGRLALIGASATTGFGTQVRLADGLAKVLGLPARELIDLGNERFFLDPDGRGARMVEQVAGVRPTLVVALDYLFWHAYGRVGDGGRAARLERGLQRLEALDCRVLVGRLPDMRVAVGAILGEGSVPDAGELAELNARIEAWAATRPRVALLPLDLWVDGVRSRRPFALEGGPWPAPEVGELLQKDALHPSTAGLATLAVLIGAELPSAAGLPARSLELDPRAVLAHLETESRARARQRLRERRERLERLGRGSGEALSTTR